MFVSTHCTLKSLKTSAFPDRKTKRQKSRNLVGESIMLIGIFEKYFGTFLGWGYAILASLFSDLKTLKFLEFLECSGSKRKSKQTILRSWEDTFFSFRDNCFISDCGLNALVGSGGRLDNDNEFIYKVIEVTVPNRYENRNYSYYLDDIALVRLDRPAKIVQPLTLMHPAFDCELCHKRGESYWIKND